MATLTRSCSGHAYSADRLGRHSLCSDLVGPLLALKELLWMIFGWYCTGTTLFFGVFLVYRIRNASLVSGEPRFFRARPLPRLEEYHQPAILLTIVQATRNRRCLNILSIIVPISLIISTVLIMCRTTILLPMIECQLLAWLSPLEPKLRHRDIQERRVDIVGEWLFQTEEFKSWHEWSGGAEGDKAVLFYYGAPGAGKTFIR